MEWDFLKTLSNEYNLPLNGKKVQFIKLQYESEKKERRKKKRKIPFFVRGSN